MRHMLPEGNLALITARSNKSPMMDHFFTARRIVEAKCGESTTQSCLAPVYLYQQPASDTTPLLDSISPWPPGRDGRTPNLAPKFVALFGGKLKLTFVSDGRGDIRKTFGPEDIFDYIYAILHSPTYRKRYAEFLKTDFPRIPLTSGRALFGKLVKLGGELVSLHLMESPVLDSKPGPAFNVQGSNEVGKAAYQPKEKRVYVNKTQHFEGVAQDVWNFHIGGYQVMAKWLKDRKGRALTTDDVRHYKRIAVAIAGTIGIMDRIDRAIPRWPVE